MAHRIKEDLDRKLGCFGLSHVFDGKGRVSPEGITIVEQITNIDEVDVVTNPGTTLSLTEQITAMQSALEADGGDGGDPPAADPNAAPAADPAKQIAELQAQVKALAEIVQTLMEKLADTGSGGEQAAPKPAKPAKFIKPKSGQVPAGGTEQTANTLPLDDPKKMAAWLRSRD
jgi:hypothetical protein